MPLLHKKTFHLQPVPKDLRPDEEVFVCPATKEVFRDYESFFNRHFLCESLVWTCEQSGKSNLTYGQALKSEEEAQKHLDSLSACYQKAALSLIHHTRRTNLKTLCEEIISFYKHRFVEGEVVDHFQTKTAVIKVGTSVRIVKVLPPAPPTSPSIIQPPTPSVDQLATKTGPETVTQNGEASNCEIIDVVSNGISEVTPMPSDATLKPVTPSVKPVFKIPKTPRTPLTPLTPEILLNADGYRYVVKDEANPEKIREVEAAELSRPKGLFTSAKLKLLLRSVLVRKSDKHPFTVKEDFARKFDLGPSTVDSILPTPSPSSRKRSLSQSQINSFFSPDSSALSPSFMSGSKPKKPRPSSLASSSKKRVSISGRKTPGKSKSAKKSKIRKSTSIQNTPNKRNKFLKSPKTPRSTAEALKLLNRAKKFKQLDLKSSTVPKGSMSAEEWKSLKKRLEEERDLTLALREAEKQRRKEERLRKLRELHEEKRRERLKQEEWLRPREDTLCEDSKPLPSPVPVSTELSPELFGDAVMLLEFLHTFGPLFNIREVIRGDITFDKIEFALTTHEIDSLLFDMVKFLLQAIFATMDEEHEGQINVRVATAKKGFISPRETAEDKTEPSKGEGPPMEQRESRSQSKEEAPEEIDDDEMEVEKDEPKSLDVRVETIKASAAKSALWSYSNQRVHLKDMTLDPYTCTEVLRLHLLSSGGYSDTEGRKRFRVYRRGGYTDSDDPVIGLRLRCPQVVEALSQLSIYGFSAKDKLEILSTLCMQLLTYADAREFIEETTARVKSIRKKIREILFSEERRKREEKSALFKEKKEKAKLEKEKIKGEADKGETEDKTSQEETIPNNADPSKVSDNPPRPKRKTSKSPSPQSSKQKEEEEKETEEERMARINEDLAELREELLEASAGVNLKPLGMDRHHSKYWVFSNLPGLFVEESDQKTVEPTPQPDTIQKTVLENGVESHDAIETTAYCDTTLAGKSDPVPAIMCSTHINTTVGATPTEMTNQATDTAPKWYYYATLEGIENLLASLNPRGTREVALKKAIETHRRHLERTLRKCPFYPDGSPRNPREGLIKNADQYLELYLREQILDIEDKILMGNLGHLKVSDNRIEWRAAIENSGAAAILANSQETSETPHPTTEEGGAPIPSGSTAHNISFSASQLSTALLQIHDGIEKKVLMPPLGTAVDTKKQSRKTKKEDTIKESDLCIEQWKDSLGQSTSFSQIFVHLATLERAVMWSKSLLNVRCRICRRKCGDEFLLLCDGCDHGYHTYCLKPPLKQIPDGDWYCYYCNPVTPVKSRRGRRVVLIEVESSDSEVELDEEPVMDMESEAEISEESEEDDEEDVKMVTRSRVTNEVPVPEKKKRGRPSKKKIIEKRQVTKTQRVKKTPKQPSNKLKRQCNNLTAVVENSRARKKLKLDSTPSKSESLIASIIELKCSRGTKSHTNASRREQKSLEMQLCEAIWQEIRQKGESSYFEAPVNKKEYPHYHEVVSSPMDLHTIKQKIKNGKCTSLGDFVQDVHLIFSNCLLYHKRHSQIGKASVTLRTYFENRCSDLGFDDLGLIEGEKNTNSGQGKLGRRSARQK